MECQIAELYFQNGIESNTQWIISKSHMPDVRPSSYFCQTHVMQRAMVTFSPNVLVKSEFSRILPHKVLHDADVSPVIG